jgi:hypothetical protein
MFPDYTLYNNVPVSIKLDVQEEIRDKGGIPAGRIENYEPCEEYLGCRWLESRVSVFTDELGFCCRNHPLMNSVKMPWDGGVSAASDLRELRERCIEGLKGGVADSPCFGCKFISKKYYRVNPKILQVAVYLKGICNYRCVYCSLTKSGAHLDPKDERIRASHERQMRLLREFESADLISKATLFSFSSFEFTNYPFREDLERFLLGYQSRFAVNGYIYSDLLAELLLKNQTSLLVSIDAGTRETYPIR